MKILELRFKNLNSLSGEWVIDFTTPEYVSNGIFAITGPTGAGKSTILDAICLALYGRTPRLKSITKSGNDIMSRQTGECFAEVTFETMAGTFRCHWSQHRARKKSDGKLADSKHEISDAITGQVLEAKKRDVAIAVEIKTGMDFDRFTRSMLLAQGGFAAFLQADSDARAPILEQITGTEIYSEISKRVHERHREENGKLTLLQAETSGIVILDEEAEIALKLEMEEKQTSEKEFRGKNDKLTSSILWLNGITTLKNELSKINIEAESLSNDLKVFTADKVKLNKSLNAAELEGEYATLVSKRQQQESDIELLSVANKVLPEQLKNLRTKDSDFKKSEAAVVEVKNKQKSELELIKQVRALDLYIKGKKTALKTAEADCNKADEQITKNKEQRTNAVFNHDSAEKELVKANTYVDANSHDAVLTTELTGIKEKVKNLKTLMDENVKTKGQCFELKKQFEAATATHVTQQKIFTNLKEKHVISQKNVSKINSEIAALLGDRMLREYRAEYETLLREMVFLTKIAELKDYRAKLEDSKPCPLCGAKEHPFAVGNIPIPDKTEKKIESLSKLITKVEELEKRLKGSESNEKEASLQVVESEKKLVKTEHKKDELQFNFERVEKELQEASGKYKALSASTLLILAPFGVSQLKVSNLQSVSENLERRLKKWQDCQILKIQIEKKKSVLETEIKQFDVIMKTINDSLKDQRAVLEIHKEELDKLIVDRETLYSNKNTDDEENRFIVLVTNAETTKSKVRESRELVQQSVNELKTRITALNEGMEKRKPELESLGLSFIDSCNKVGFSDESTFISYRLASDERNKLSQRAKELDDKQADISARKKDRAGRLELEIEKSVTEIPLEDLKEQQIETQDLLKKVGEEIGAIKQKIFDNNAAKSKIMKKYEAIESQKKESSRWDSLHALIGSADGKKYRNFAQGLTFELMVSHANIQLEKMTDRYLLIRDEEKPLELNVVDNYQAGEIRSTKNLSGGESFIVSLSLALGLSKMASRKVRVDSLFLDEGFGTLDEDALETALDTLSGLQQDGKLIGIISHIPALKERISTQISVMPISGGKSTISGPGCLGKF